jgi:superfamily II DNA or RNA helicase
MNFYEELIGGCDLKWAIENGWAVPPRCKLAKVESLDLSNIRVVNGDFAQQALAEEMNKEANIQRLCLITAEEMEGQTVLFTASVSSSKAAAHYCNHNYGIPAVYVYGTQPPEERAEALRKFKSGEARVLCNCQVVAVGFDYPPTQTLILGRPTKSRSFWLQCVGRATRPLAGVVDLPGGTAQDRIAAIASSSKRYFKIVDCTTGSLDHTVVTSVDMFCVASEEAKREVREAAGQKPLTAEELQTIADMAAAREEERRRREEERRAAAKMIELMRQNTAGRAEGRVVGRDLDITYTGKRSVGTYTNPLRGKYGGKKFSELPDFYLSWMQRERSVPNWAKGIAKREQERRREQVGSVG